MEHVLNVLGRLNAAPTPPCVETSLQLKDEPLADTSRYDGLRSDDEDQLSTEEIDHAL